MLDNGGVLIVAMLAAVIVSIGYNNPITHKIYSDYKAGKFKENNKDKSNESKKK